MTDVDHIYVEDCLETLRRINKGEVQYVFTIPPDFEELGMHPIKDEGEYAEYICRILERCGRICPVVTVGITDRKCESRIAPKHWHFMDLFRRIGWGLVAHKIWMRSDKINLYRINYTHVMSFAARKPKQNWPKEFRYDVFTDTMDANERFAHGAYAVPVSLVTKHLLNFTQPGDVVYDPFTGSGTTALACLDNNRHYIGSEIIPEIAAIAEKRLQR